MVATEAYEFRQVAGDVAGSEGPVFDRAGTFYCVAPDRGQVLRLGPDGALRELAITGGIPAGLQADARGRLWVADMKLGILRVDPTDRKVRDVVREFDGRPIRGCNDLSFDSRGNLYFTAPAGSKAGVPVGEIFCRNCDGWVRRLDAGFEFCNGIAVSADDRTLVVAETWPKKLWAYDVESPGTVSNRRPFAMTCGEHFGGPDGIDFDVDGNLLVTNWGGACVEVFDPHGRRVEKIDLPFEKPSNLHLGGADGRDLWITEHTHMGVWKTRWRSAGLTRFPDAD